MTSNKKELSSGADTALAGWQTWPPAHVTAERLNNPQHRVEAIDLGGRKAEKALEIFSTAFCLRSSFHCNGDQTGKGYSNFRYRPFTLEGNFASAAGLQEMLLQSYSGTIIVFPAIPTNWKDVSFTTLRAEGAFLVSAERRDGLTRHVKIQAEKGGLCCLENPFPDSGFKVEGILNSAIQIKDNKLNIQMSPGEQVTLVRKD